MSWGPETGGQLVAARVQDTTFWSFIEPAVNRFQDDCSQLPPFRLGLSSVCRIADRQCGSHAFGEARGRARCKLLCRRIRTRTGSVCGGESLRARTNLLQNVTPHKTPEILLHVVRRGINA